MLSFAPDDPRPMRLWLVLVLLFVVACGRQNPESHAGKERGAETLELRYEGAANSVNYPELAEDLGFLAPVKLVHMGSNSTGGPQSIQAVAAGHLDIGSSFNGPIIKTIASKAPLVAVLASYGTDERTFSGFYTLPDSPIRSARDLIGKTVSMNTLGAHAEFMLRDYLVKGGLTPEEIKQVTLLALPPTSAELALRNHQIDATIFSTILRDKAAERGALRMLASDHELYGAFNAGSYVMRRDFVEKNPNTVRRFVEGTGRAIEWARTHSREEVLARFHSIIARRKRNESSSQVKYWLSTGIATPHGEPRDADYQVWINWLVRDGQLAPGQVRPKDIYKYVGKLQK